MLRKLTFCLSTLAVLWPAAQMGTAAPAPAQQPAAQKQWKDRQEYDLYSSIVKETDAKKRLQLLDQWKQKYADTAFKEERLKAYMQVYQQAGQPAKAVETAKEVLAGSPNDFSANYMMASLTPFLGSSDQAVWDDGAKASSGLLQSIDAQFAADKKPANVSDADWENAKKGAQVIAHQTLGWVAKMEKKNEDAEKEFIQVLQLNPQMATVSFWLGEAVLAEKNPDKNALALFSFARAASYDGPGALTPQGRQQLDAYLAKVYKGYHGDDPKGLADLKAMAKASPLPPPDLKIKSKEEVAVEKEEDLRKSDPLLAVFLQIKEGLSGADGAKFWDDMKGKAMPELKGTVVSAKPAIHPKVVEVALSQATTTEVTIAAPETSARCKLEPGAVIHFKDSEAKEFTPTPFMIKMEGGKITEGCTEAPVPRRAPAKKSATKKKAG
ncbi:MAG TPA: hypothetical protein VEU62_08125 [Bryobacterales bacterium]|nr:hypothetical protein [Bryobacterales bacterium]